MSTSTRCPWARTALEQSYHDDEWGRPLHGDQALFELLELEGFQAGLSWGLILERRPALRSAFAGFDPQILAQWGEEDIAAALTVPGVIKNRAKARCAVSNAKAFLAVQREFGTFDRYLWSWVEGAPLVNHWDSPDQVPAETPLSQALSADLRCRGFKCVGPVIIYSYLQSAGLINDHLTTCPWHALCQEGSRP